MSSALATARFRSPDLDDPNRYACRTGIPILDEHVRKGRDVDSALLSLVVANTNRACSLGEYPLLLIGHTDDDGPEVDQPPVVGFVKNFRMGDWRGKACIFGDLYIARDKLAQAMQYPRRSAEVYYSDHPSDNVIDSVSLLVRTPERQLGLVTYARSGKGCERYEITPRETDMTTIAAIERYGRQTEAAVKKVVALEKKVEAITLRTTLERYGADLTRLKAEGYQMDLREELSHVATLDQSGFDKHKARIKARYSRAALPTTEDPAVEGARIARYIKDKGFGPERYTEGLAAYKAEKKTKASGR